MKRAISEKHMGFLYCINWAFDNSHLHAVQFMVNNALFTQFISCHVIMNSRKPLDSTLDTKCTKEQKSNFESRDNFLHFLKCCTGSNASIRMYECSKLLSCQVEAFEPSIKHIAVSNLQTPIGIEKHCIIRANDLIEIKFHKKNQD